MEEEDFPIFLIEVAQAGYGKTRKEVRNIAGRVAVDKKRKKILSVLHGSYHKGDPTANVRMNCLTKKVMSDYFDLLKEVFTTNQLLDSPSRIYNIDETGIALDGHAPRVVAKRGQKSKVQNHWK